MSLWCCLFHRHHHYSNAGGYRGLLGRWVLRPPVHCALCGEGGGNRG